MNWIYAMLFTANFGLIGIIYHRIERDVRNIHNKDEISGIVNAIKLELRAEIVKVDNSHTLERKDLVFAIGNINTKLDATLEAFASYRKESHDKIAMLSNTVEYCREAMKEVDEFKERIKNETT